jgi:hypothetical protein
MLMSHMTKKKYESIFDLDSDDKHKLTNDSASMAFAAFLTKEHNKMELSPE